MTPLAKCGDNLLSKAAEELTVNRRGHGKDQVRDPTAT